MGGLSCLEHLQPGTHDCEAIPSWCIFALLNSVFSWIAAGCVYQVVKIWLSASFQGCQSHQSHHAVRDALRSRFLDFCLQGSSNCCFCVAPCFRYSRSLFWDCWKLVLLSLRLYVVYVNGLCVLLCCAVLCNGMHLLLALECTKPGFIQHSLTPSYICSVQCSWKDMLNAVGLIFTSLFVLFSSS